MKQRLLIFWLAGFLGVLTRGAAAQNIDPALNIATLRQPVDIKAAIQQTDGKHVLVGFFTTAEGAPSGGLARYNANHTVDQTFNANVAALRGTLNNVRQLPSGKLLLIGPDTIRLGSMLRRNLLRLNADGTPDASFDAGRAAPVTTQYLVTAVQPDGKILVGGDFQTFNGMPANRLVRLLPDGGLDLGFTCAAPLNGAVRKILVQPDGKILVGGGFSTPRRIVRLEATGAVDNTFTSPIPSANVAPSGGVVAIGLQPDGKIIIGGSLMSVRQGLVRYIARLLPDGTLDNSFQTPNTIDYSASVTNPYDACEVAVLTDGRIVLSGFKSTEYFRVPVNGFICLTATGSVSSSFNNILLPDERSGPNVGSEYLTSLFRQSNGQWLIAGNSKLLAGQRSHVALLNADGTHDASFAPNLLTEGYVNDVVQQPDAKLIIGGAFDEINGTRVTNVARLHPNGAVDTAFSRWAGMRYEVAQVALDTGGKVLVASAYGKGLVRLLSTGAPDAGFVIPSNNYGTGVSRLLLQPDGRIIIISAANLSVQRLLADGQLDLSFTPYSNSMPSTLALQPNGKLLVGGFLDYDSNTNQYNRALIRLLPDGSRDVTFTEIADPIRFRVLNIGLQSTGKIVVSSSPYTGGNRLIRLLPDGQPDPTFTPLPIPRAYDGAAALCIQPNDRILVATYAYYNYSGGTLIRLLPDGTPDNSFSSVPFYGMPSSTIIQTDGQLVLGGYFTDVAGTPRVGLVRLQAANVLHAAEQRLASSLAVWPVPVREVLRVQLPAGAAAAALTLLNAQGQVVRRQPQPGSSFNLDVRHLPAGVYMLRVEYAEGVAATRRVLVE